MESGYIQFWKRKPYLIKKLTWHKSHKERKKNKTSSKISIFYQKLSYKFLKETKDGNDWQSNLKIFVPETDFKNKKSTDLSLIRIDWS